MGDAQRNADFYAGILGLRLVKNHQFRRPPRSITSTLAMSRVRRGRSSPSSHGLMAVKAESAAARSV
ncbi:hypothetical protein ACFSQ7_03740 [Paenibacillus rhizoplanae]